MVAIMDYSATIVTLGKKQMLTRVHNQYAAESMNEAEQFHIYPFQTYSNH